VFPDPEDGEFGPRREEVRTGGTGGGWILIRRWEWECAGFVNVVNAAAGSSWFVSVVSNGRPVRAGDAQDEEEGK